MTHPSIEDLVAKHPELKLLSKSKLYERIRNLGHTHITKRDVDAFLNPKEITQLYARPRYTKKNFQFRITAPPYSFQVDVALLPAYKKSNSGVDKFFIAVDILSRKAFAYPLKNGEMSSVLKAYEQFLTEVYETASAPVNSVAGDAFFDNNAFRSMNEELDILVYTDVAKDDHITKMGDKLGIVDRCIRTIKQLIQKYMLIHKTTKWTTFLHTIVELYNNTPHSSIKNMTPDEVYDDYDYLVLLHDAQHKRNTAANAKIKVEPGDHVRVMVGKGIFEKEKAKFSSIVYTVLRQEGYRFILVDADGDEVKRRYRPSELLVVDEEPTRVSLKETTKEKAEAHHAKIRRVAKALGTSYAEATRAIKEATKPRSTMTTRRLHTTRSTRRSA